MNSKDFIQALRKVIREEVQNAVRTELSKIPPLTEQRKPINKAPIQERTTVTTKVTARKPTMKQYTENPTLNELLNHTAGFSNENSGVYLEESIGVNHIDYNDQSEWPTMTRKPMSSKPAIVSDVHGQKIDVNQLAATEAGAAVVNALTKDYSALMKAIDKKKSK